MSPFRPQTSSLRRFSRFFPVSQFTLSRGKIRLCTFYTFLIGGLHRYCTRNLSPFRPQTSSLRLFSRFFPVSQFTLSRGKIRLCTSYTFLNGGVHRHCTRNLSPFRLQTSSLRLFSRFSRFLNLPSPEAKSDYALLILFYRGCP